MIIPSKQVVLLAPANTKQQLLFDPKTACVLNTYTSQSELLTKAGYFQDGQEFIIPHLNNSYLNVWDTDAKQGRKFTVGDGQKISAITMGDGNICYLGSSTGALYIYQLPSGILIKKSQLHSTSSPITKITLLPTLGYILTTTKKQIKQWNMYTIFQSNSSSKVLPNHTIQSVLQILDVHIVREVLCLITQRNIMFYYVNNFYVFQMGRDMPAMQNVVCSCGSSVGVFVGDAAGKIREIVVDVAEKEVKYEERKGKVFVQSKKGIQLDLKQPIVSLVYIQALEYLISTTTKGQLKIHHRQTLKNSLQLSKSPLCAILCFPRPNRDKKIPQSHKIRSFHKQELSKIEQPILFIQNSGSNGLSLNKLKPTQEDINNEIILQRMLGYLNDTSQQVLEQMQQLKKDNKSLIQANLQYFNALQCQQMSKN